MEPIGDIGLDLEPTFSVLFFEVGFACTGACSFRILLLQQSVFACSSILQQFFCSSFHGNMLRQLFYGSICSNVIDSASSDETIGG